MSQSISEDPTEEDLNSPMFEAIWQAIKKWDIERNYGGGYAGATGTDVKTILNAVEPIIQSKISQAYEQGNEDGMKGKIGGFEKIEITETYDIPEPIREHLISQAITAERKELREKVEASINEELKNSIKSQKEFDVLVRQPGNLLQKPPFDDVANDAYRSGLINARKLAIALLEEK